MRLLHRPPEITPSLETWLSRDVPHEREMAGELLEKMGREKSLAALLALHDKEETKRAKQRRNLRRFAITVVSTAWLIWLSGLPWLHLIRSDYAQFLFICLNFAGAIIGFGATFFGYAQWTKASQRQKNIIAALFNYQDSPMIADPLCRAIAYYDGPDRWEVFAGLMHVLPLLPSNKDALTKDAREWLLNRLLTMESKTPPEPTREDYNAGRTRYADFEIAVLRYFARTRDRLALPAIRRLVKAKPFSDDSRRVQDAARTALLAFEERGA